MLKPGKTYEDVYNNFQWQIPEFYNIGIDICDKWAQQRDRLALIYEDKTGHVQKYTFRDLKNFSNKSFPRPLNLMDNPLHCRSAQTLDVRQGFSGATEAERQWPCLSSGISIWIAGRRNVGGLRAGNGPRGLAGTVC